MYTINTKQQPYLALLLGSVLLGFLATPANAHKWQKAPAALGNAKAAAAERTLHNPAFAAALRHAQALQILQNKTSCTKAPIILQETNSSVSAALAQQTLSQVHKRPYSPRKSPEQWLEELAVFIDKNKRFPSAYKNPRERALYVAVNNIKKRLGPNSAFAKQLEQLRQNCPPAYVGRPGKPPQQWLEELETFIQENGRFPSYVGGEQEPAFYTALQSIINRLGREHPISQRITELRLKTPTLHDHKFPQQWLEELEIFIQKNGRFPSVKNSIEEKKLCVAIWNLKYRLGPKHPILQRITQLRAQYSPQENTSVNNEKSANE